MKKFPNKMVKATYLVALGRTFTWSPTRQVFTDESGNSDYNYSAMVWLKEHGILEQLPFRGVIIDEFRIKE